LRFDVARPFRGRVGRGAESPALHGSEKRAGAESRQPTADSC